MEYRKFGSMYVIRLDKGDEIVASLKSLCKSNSITLGWVSGIGAVNKATIGLFETETKRYLSSELSGDFEITALSGNISTMDGEIYLHLHATLSDIKHQTFGGHLNSAFISATGELIVSSIEGAVDREFSSEIGLNLMNFT